MDQRLDYGEGMIALLVRFPSSCNPRLVKVEIKVEVEVEVNVLQELLHCLKDH